MADLLQTILHEARSETLGLEAERELTLLYNAAAFLSEVFFTVVEENDMLQPSISRFKVNTTFNTCRRNCYYHCWF